MTYNAEQIQDALNRLRDSMDEATSAYESEMAALRAKAQKLEDWLWEHGEHNANTVTEEYVAMRDLRAANKKAYDTEDARIKEQMRKREIWLMEAMSAIDAEALRTEHGTAYIQTKNRFNCGDWPGYWQFIKENDRFDLLEKRPAQGPLGKMLEEGEDLPPGINTYSERTVTVRRS